MIAFGPVPSRRLGYSLGINHIPPKHCPYSCIYCQVGRTTTLEITRQGFYAPDRILADVERKISESTKTGQPIDYLTLVPDGEPTLDRNLGTLINGLKQYGIPIAVISNASLIDHEEVQVAMLQADWVSLKVDAIGEANWHRINRPHGCLSLTSILKNILIFRGRFHGTLVTETMLISGINDRETAIHDLKAFLLELQPFKSYLSIPIRPPAESWVKPPSPAVLQNIFQVVSDTVQFVDFLFESEATDFSTTGNLDEDILGITAVHPLRAEALRRMVSQAGADWMVVENLLTSRKITAMRYRGETFYFHNPLVSNQINQERR